MTKLNLACGPHLLDGFENLDASTGWRFETGFPDIPDGSIEAISESHGLMYVPAVNWEYVFKEIARVLEPGGIVRITEDDTEHPDSERFGGWHDAVTLTSAKLVSTHLRQAKLTVVKGTTMTTSAFRDRSLIQAHHGQPPKVFVVEARKP